MYVFNKFLIKTKSCSSISKMLVYLKHQVTERVNEYDNICASSKFFITFISIMHSIWKKITNDEFYFPHYENKLQTCCVMDFDFMELISESNFCSN